MIFPAPHLPEYSALEVAQHCTEDSSWLIICGYVLDITAFIHSHPGGDSILLPYLGKDATTVFIEYAHSDMAEQMIPPYIIGRCTNTTVNRVNQKEANALLKRINALMLSPSQSSPSQSSSPQSSSPQSSSPQSSSPQSSPAHLSPPQSTTEEEFDYHQLINFKKPLLPQIWSLDKETYFKVVDKPNSTTEVLTIFPWPFVEALSKTEWYIIPTLYIPIITALLTYSLTTFDLPLYLTMGYFLTGAFLWTLFEYIFHRFIFHCLHEYMPEHWLILSLHFLVHSVHHMLPMDPLRLVMPPPLLLFLTSPFLYITYRFVPPVIAFPGWAGVLFGYLCYDMIHFSAHHWGISHAIPHVHEMKKYHMKHHYKTPDQRFGVSTKIWDVVFRTMSDE